MNDFDLCLEVVLRSCQPLRHICYISETVGDAISRKRLVKIVIDSVPKYHR